MARLRFSTRQLLISFLWLSVGMAAKISNMRSLPCSRLWSMVAVLLAACRIAAAETIVLDTVSDAGLGVLLYKDRVSLVMESSLRSKQGENSIVAQLRGYLVTVTLPADEQGKVSHRIVGPLWQMDGPVSAIAIEAGAPYSDADRKHLAARPRLTFGNRGELVRSRVIDSGKTIREWTLNTQGPKAVWQASGERPRLQLRGLFSAGEWDVSPIRYAVQLENGVPVLYDRQLGTPVVDSWLNKVLSDLARPNQPGWPAIKITQDLNHVIARFTRRQPTQKAIVGDAAFDVQRDVQIYSRPNAVPTVGRGFGQTGTPISVAGDLMFLTSDLTLCNADGQVRFRQQLSAEEASAIQWAHRSYDPDEKRIVFTAPPVVYSAPGALGGPRERGADGS